ncbi:DUF2382 domain-containing protein [Chamaesiphon polymorphus]|uniref:Photosystem reaction center subunit H n=1 Tax=Chamaesiphon polymorphus CCALA 037 TaxID=2107692 RepID=A0A2T1GBZ8_9CYAN|nr:DUF2382 domain-containing protein [Chamaesiphon polymorphus]PSB54820.1 photosystem reaction center subunit H [Chamaesiphon polymorphus CCALA 037]
MALHKIKDFNPDYKAHFGDRDIKGLDVYVADDKIGSVDDVLVDDGGQFRYLVINTGAWIIGKKVLLPIGRARVDDNAKRVYAIDLTKAQVEALPEFTNDMVVDYDHEERVRGVYRGGATPMQQDVSSSVDMPTTGTAMMDRDNYAYDREPDLYEVNDRDNATLKLYEERLVSSKTRQKTGEAVISKHVETETATASVSVDKERVVVERMPASSTGTPVPTGTDAFKEGEVARMDVYEEVPEFRKEAFVREEVKVTKVVDTENATAQEQLRREELDVDVDGNPVIDNKI